MLARMGGPPEGDARPPHTKWAWRHIAKCVTCEIGNICVTAHDQPSAFTGPPAGRL